MIMVELNQISKSYKNKKGMLERGDKIVMCGFGGGLTWGTIYLEW